MKNGGGEGGGGGGGGGPFEVNNFYLGEFLCSCGLIS